MKRTALCLSLAVLPSASLCGEEGMWTFDNVPAVRIQARYGFAPDAAWLEHARLSALRLPGGSGAFISADGLVLTNHHVAHSWIEQIGDAAHDYVKNGFTAPDRARELPVPGLEVRTLMAMENVSAALKQAVKPPAADAEAGRARRETLARLVQEAEARTGLASEPVTLYHGGETWIYSYQVHSDVRLVMAPEYGIAAFGRDWDNFTYPRHDLDFALFRVYEHGQPYHPAHHLRWSRDGLKAGERADYALGAGRKAYLVPAKGAVEVNGVRLETRDGAAIENEDVSEPGIAGRPTFVNGRILLREEEWKPAFARKSAVDEPAGNQRAGRSFEMMRRIVWAVTPRSRAASPTLPSVLRSARSTIDFSTRARESFIGNSLPSSIIRRISSISRRVPTCGQ